MIKRYHPFRHQVPSQASKELQIFSILAQSFFQPFSLKENLLVILTALTAGSGLGFNRAMLFLVDQDKLKGEFWLGPSSAEEAASLWQVLSTPEIGYAEIIDYNRRLLMDETNPLVQKIRQVSFSLSTTEAKLPALAAISREIILVKDAYREPLVDAHFLKVIQADEFLCIPLLSPDEIFGEIILDNAITKRPIEDNDVELASLCGLTAGNYIYITRLQQKIGEMKRQAALGEMAMFITHQLRNPLVAIGGFVDQLLSLDLDEKKKKRNLQIIKEEIERLEKVMTRLSGFFRIDLKERIPVNLQEIFKLTIETVKPLIKSQKITMEMDIEPGLTHVLSEPVYLGEALRNLVENSIEALKNGGIIKLKAFRQNEEWIVIAVEDNGPGIPKSLREKIFEAFMSTKERGLGLGLAYVKRFMEASGGRIEVESQEGQGTTIKLFFKTG